LGREGKEKGQGPLSVASVGIELMGKGLMERDSLWSHSKDCIIGRLPQPWAHLKTISPLCTLASSSVEWEIKPPSLNSCEIK
jgi:hypothetical protein